MPSQLYNEMSIYGWTIYTIRIMFECYPDSPEEDIIECLAELNNRKFNLMPVIYYSLKKSLNKVALWCFQVAKVPIYHLETDLDSAVKNKMNIEVIEELINAHSRAYKQPPKDLYQYQICKFILFNRLPDDMIIPMTHLCLRYCDEKFSDNIIDIMRKIINRGNANNKLQAAIVLFIRAHLCSTFKLRAAKIIVRHLKERIYAPDHIWWDHRKTIERFRPRELAK